ncbi:MAG: CopD family protein [Gammaproteobacteria bacterium]|nr:CopD family protein [Gammaproteobacteria bacterium]MCH9743642.1 CopD family protein [Gammaproteobacteria bacterium]
MQLVLAFHIIFMVAWFAGLFYLPRLYVYHAASSDQISLDRFKVMEHKLFYYIMTPAGILTTIFGYWLLSFRWQYYQEQNWMHAKLILVLVLWIYHIYCGKLLYNFKCDANTFSEKFYRFFNEVPTLLLIAIVLLAVLRPGA